MLLTYHLSRVSVIIMEPLAGVKDHGCELGLGHEEDCMLEAARTTYQDSLNLDYGNQKDCYPHCCKDTVALKLAKSCY